MPGLTEGGRNYSCAESAVNAKELILVPLVYNFVARVLGRFKETYPLASIGPDINATEISDDTVYLKNWTAVLDGSVDPIENQRLAVKVYVFLQDAGFEIIGNWGQGFDLKISREDFEKAVSCADVVGDEIEDIRGQIPA